jgi:hypothetical protein
MCSITPGSETFIYLTTEENSCANNVRPHIFVVSAMAGLLSGRTVGLGVASWAIPMAAAFAFFDRTGALAVPQPLFKSAMVVIGSTSGSLLLLRALDGGATAAGGAALGALWMVLNWALDVAVLLPMNGQTPAEYAADIGLRYLTMPLLGWLVGVAAERGRAAAAAAGTAKRK